METISVNYKKKVNKIKPMHAVNNGPINARTEQVRSNFGTYKDAKIPYARTHDASFCANYGGEHCVDVHAIFPDFSKNPYDPSSYDFTLTDDYLNRINDAGTKIYYRLGSKIEHWRKKYGTIVPADFKKWAVICEHIIRHYTLGWADGFYLDIEYWEIWNEPDGIKDNGDQPNWSGTPEQFYEFYKVAACHLKKCFPKLKIGGPAISWVKHEQWFDGFLAALTENGERTPLDFFSWHTYPNDTDRIQYYAETVRKKLDEAGYTNTESHANEWNYLEGWGSEFISSIENIIGMRGAAFTAAAMARGQKSPLDMMMYYDARPSAFNGMFDFYTLRPLKGYYPFLMFSKLYELKDEVESETSHDDLYVVSAKNNDKQAMMITYYSLDKQAEPKEVELEILGDNTEGEWNVQILDKDRTMEEFKILVENNKARLTINHETVLFISK